jgi:hypothetical protein
MYVQYDEKKNSVIIEVSPRQLASIVAAQGRASEDDLRKSHNVNASHLAPNYPIFRALDKMYYKLRDSEVY